ncbi:IS30 family transposase [Clostridium neonatale]|uniref:IS30 family transposase n=1 Tax=Clostridium neonatale TaxID=137838 RepID=UPI00289A8879|nr:IS30 family transposase [Clostridium neonatale]
MKAFNSFNNTTVKALTIDSGKEFAGYLDLESTLKVNVYFADPYSSWQRGANGLIRKFFPKKFDFSTITQENVDIVENILNNIPRKCLEFKAPLEVFNELSS